MVHEVLTGGSAFKFVEIGSIVKVVLWEFSLSWCSIIYRLNCFCLQSFEFIVPSLASWLNNNLEKKMEVSVLLL